MKQTKQNTELQQMQCANCESYKLILLGLSKPSEKVIQLTLCCSSCGLVHALPLNGVLADMKPKAVKPKPLNYLT